MTTAKSKLLLILLSLGVYLLSAGIAYAVFTASNSGIIFTSPLTDTANNPAEVNNNRKVLIEITGSKSEVCPLNGAKFTKAEKNIWESRRPLAVMIENHLEARPQSGLSDADIIYEVVAEGGITRFMALYYCQAAAYETTLGPVRSARTYYIDWASEYNLPLYVHVGGANTPGPANALGQLESYDWSGANDLNQFSIGYPTFWRDYERLGRTVATEHTMYSTTEKLWAIAAKRGFTNLDPDQNNWLDDFTPWKFAQDEAGAGNQGAVQTISYPFWEYADYDVGWQYDKDKNIYTRSNGGQPHQDLNTGQPLTAINLVVQLATERNANDGYEGNVHLLYGTIGKGKAYIFKDGQAIEGSWAKAKRLSRTIFSDAQGKEILFNPGKIWISVLPVGTKVTY